MRLQLVKEARWPKSRYLAPLPSPSGSPALGSCGLGSRDGQAAALGLHLALALCLMTPPPWPQQDQWRLGSPFWGWRWLLVMGPLAP